MRGRKKKNKTDASFVVQGGQAPTNEVFDAAKVEKEFYEIFNYQRKQRNNLLGTFNGKEYTIDEEIKTQLLVVPKRFVNFEDNLAYAAVKLNNFVLNFKVEFDIDESFCRAKFFIIEMEEGFEEDIKHTTLLDSVIEPYSFGFRDEVFAKWNIFYDGDENQKNDLLQAYLHMQNEEWLFNREITEILSQLYVLRLLQILETLGQEGQKTAYEFKLAMEKLLQQNPDFANNFTMQKVLLDQLMLKNNVLPKVLETEDGKKILQGYTKPLKNIKDKTYPTILDDKKQEKTADKPADKKKAEASKPKKKSASKKPLKPFILDMSKVFPKAKSEKKKEEEKAKPKGVVVAIGTSKPAPAPKAQMPNTPQPAVPPQNKQPAEDDKNDAISQAEVYLADLLEDVDKEAILQPERVGGEHDLTGTQNIPDEKNPLQSNIPDEKKPLQPTTHSL